jgi:hypothetical protein
MTVDNAVDLIDEEICGECLSEYPVVSMARALSQRDFWCRHEFF